jgi:sulfite exporter TauE/SafE
MWEAMVGLGAGAIAGLVSIPHCAAMCGPLSAFACGRAASRFAPLRYQAGRTVGYALAGGVMGYAGEMVTRSLSAAWTSAILSWTLAIALGATAWKLWATGPSARVAAENARLVALSPARPVRSGLDRLLALVPRDPLVFGVATALLPCGALYAALALAAGTTSVLGGVAVMLGFATASGVALVSAAWLARQLRVSQHHVAARVLAAALAVGAVFLAIRPVPTLAEPEAKPACCAATE